MKAKKNDRRKPFQVFGQFNLAKGERELAIWQGLEYGPAIALRKASIAMWKHATVRWKHIEESIFKVRRISHAQYANLTRSEAGHRRK